MLMACSAQSGDAIATKKVCVAVVQVCFAAAKWTELNEHIVLLSKRRSQLKQAVTGMVQEAMTYIDQVSAQPCPHHSHHALSLIGAAAPRPAPFPRNAKVLSQAIDRACECGLGLCTRSSFLRPVCLTGPPSVLPSTPLSCRVESDDGGAPLCVCVWQITDLPVKTALIETLSTVTAGKIYVEVERARLVRQLAKIKEAAGDIDAAAEAMQEVAVRLRRP